MKAGSLRHVVTIQEPVETQDEYGQTVTTWRDVQTVNASIEPLTAREFFAAQQTKADVTHKVRLRYVAGIVPTMRLLFGSRVFHLGSVLNREERGIELELLCKEAL